MSFVLFVPRERSCADDPPESRLLCSLAFVSTPKRPLLSTSFNLVYFLLSHNSHSWHAHDFAFFFFSFDQNFFFQTLCVRKAPEVAWTQTSGFFWNNKAWLLCSKLTHTQKQPQWPLCVSIVAAEKGFLTRLGSLKSSNVTNTNVCDILDSARTKLDEDSLRL